MKFFNKSILKEYGFALAQRQSNPLWRETFNIIIEDFCLILYSMYSHENLPDEMDGDFLERCLMEDGIAGAFDHPLYGLINSRATWGELGIYNRPIESTFYSIKFSKQVYVGIDSDNAVLFYNNSLGIGYVRWAISYAERLADILISHSINLMAQRTPILIDGDYNQLEDIVAQYAKYIGGAPVIARTRSMRNTLAQVSATPLTVLKTDAPFTADKIYFEYTNVLHEFFSKIGINFANNNKKERMLVDEVNANNEQLNFKVKAGLAFRNKGWKQFNKIHGTNIVSVYNGEVEELASNVIERHTDAIIRHSNGELSS